MPVFLFGGGAPPVEMGPIAPMMALPSSAIVRAAVTAFVIAVAPPPDVPPPIRASMEMPSRAIVRPDITRFITGPLTPPPPPAKSRYILRSGQILSRAAIPLPPGKQPLSIIPFVAPGPQRASPHAYSIIVPKTQDPPISPSELLVVPSISQPPPNIIRACSTAYSIAVRLLIDPPPPSKVRYVLSSGTILRSASTQDLSLAQFARYLPDFARGPQRAARIAYQITIPSPNDGGTAPIPALMPDQFRFPIHAAWNPSSVPSPLDAGRMPIPASIPDQFRSRPRAGWIPFIVPSPKDPQLLKVRQILRSGTILTSRTIPLDTSLFGVRIPWEAKGGRRTSSFAYHITNTPPVDAGLLPIPSLMPDQYRQAPRAAWMPSSVPSPRDPGSIPVLISIPDRAPAASRAGWIPTFAMSPLDGGALPIPICLPDRAVGAVRAAQSAYWINPHTLADAGKISFPTNLPDVARGPQRTSRPAYDILVTKGLEPLVVGPPPIIFVHPAPVRAPLRAVRLAYSISVSAPQDQVTFQVRTLIRLGWASVSTPSDLPSFPACVPDAARFLRRTAASSYDIIVPPLKDAGFVEQPPSITWMPDYSRGAITNKNADGFILPSPLPIVTYAARYDSFNRPDDASALGTPSDGGSDWVATQGTWGIINNQGYSPSPIGVEGFAYLEFGTSDGDVSVQMATAVNSAILVRFVDVNNAIIAVWRTSGLPNKFELTKIANGVYTPLGIYNGGTPGNRDRLRVSMLGSSISVYWTPAGQAEQLIIGPVIESFNSAATKHGLYRYDFGDRFDDFNILFPEASQVFPNFARSPKIAAQSTYLITSNAIPEVDTTPSRLVFPGQFHRIPRAGEDAYQINIPAPHDIGLDQPVVQPVLPDRAAAAARTANNVYQIAVPSPVDAGIIPLAEPVVIVAPNRADVAARTANNAYQIIVPSPLDGGTLPTPVSTPDRTPAASQANLLASKTAYDILISPPIDAGATGFPTNTPDIVYAPARAAHYVYVINVSSPADQGVPPAELSVIPRMPDYSRAAIRAASATYAITISPPNFSFRDFYPDPFAATITINPYVDPFSSTTIINPNVDPFRATIIADPNVDPFVSTDGYKTRSTIVPPTPPTPPIPPPTTSSFNLMGLL